MSSVLRFGQSSFIKVLVTKIKGSVFLKYVQEKSTL